MKDDVEIPAAPPAKRRVLEDPARTLDQWLAVWAADESLPPSARRRAQEERGRRKDLRRAGPPVIIGFTGSRAGMTPEQRVAVVDVLAGPGVVAAHHGMCVGADETFNGFCHDLGIPVTGHPSTLKRFTADCPVDELRPELPPLERNQNIVKAGTVLLAAPKESREPPPARGQGTWSTVRYARKRGARRIVVMPDGTIREES